MIVGAAIFALSRSGLLTPTDDDSANVAGKVAALESRVADLQAGAAEAETPREDTLAPMRDQLAALTQTVEELRSAPPTTDASDETIEALRGRVAQLEESAATAAGTTQDGAGPDVAARISALSSDIDALKGSLSDLSGSQASLEALRNDLDALSARIDSLPGEERVRSIEGKLGDIGQQIDKTAALGPAVAAGALGAAVESGRPFAQELAALETLGVDPDVIERLQPQAESGLPTLAQLREQFESQIAAVDLSPGVSENAGAIDRLLESARGLVDVRPANPTAGSDPSAIVTRIRGALASGDLKTALAEWETLPDGARSATSDWASAAGARMTADDLVVRLRADALAQLESEG
jgi:hypothetical protein